MISNFVRDFDGRVVGVEFDIELVDVEWYASIFNLCNRVTITIIRLLLVQELFGVLILAGLVLSLFLFKGLVAFLSASIIFSNG